MRIQGLQKLTLLDYPGRTACTVFCLAATSAARSAITRRCSPQRTKTAWTKTSCWRFEKRQGLLDGVAVTGGEPLLRPELPALLEKIKALGYAIKLDTNGAFPEQLEAVVRAGLADYVAMDVKNSPVRYAQTVGAVELDLMPIDKSVSFLLRDTVDYEFRTTAVAEIHDDASFLSLADWLAGARRYYIQRFQPRDTVLRAGLSAPSEMQLHCWAELVRPKIPAVEIRGI